MARDATTARAAGRGASTDIGKRNDRSPAPSKQTRIQQAVMADRRKRSRGAWFWRHRSGGRPAIVEQLADGRWAVTIGGRQIGTVNSRAAAERLVELTTTSADGGGTR